MSKNDTGRKPEQKGRKGFKGKVDAPDAGRRRMIWIGAGSVATIGLAGLGWYASRESGSAPAGPAPKGAAAVGGKSLPPLLLSPDAANALRVCDEMLQHYTHDLNNPSAIIHAIRGFGKGFRLADGSLAVDHLCNRYALDREVNGRRYVFFGREAEVHENSFLKTFLEAGVPFEQPLQVGERRYTLRDVAESAQALFRCDPNNLFKYDADGYRYDSSFIPRRQAAPGQAPETRGELIHEHLPWGIIAFSLLVPATAPSTSWTNAWGEQIDWPLVVDRSLAEYEATCALGEQEIARGEAAPANFRTAIKKYSCFGLHTAYSYLVSLRQGYRVQDLPSRVSHMLDLLTYRLRSDAEAIEREYAQEAAGAAPQLVEAFSTRALVKLYGHAFEAINYARLHELVKFTPGQERRITAGEQAMYESLIRLRGMDWAMLRRSLGDKFISDIIIALGHASRALKLTTPQNPDLAV